MVRFKKCFKCRAVKSLDEFYVHQQMADGHLNKCKECAKIDVKAHRLKNIEKVRLYDRLRGKNKERIAATVAHNRIWREQDRRRSKAHSAVARAIRSGKLVRCPCVFCGEQKSIAHHENYDYPLDVVWLCQPCHMKKHKGE